ncbi:hypothetical protein TNCV_831761 [Trichonephila clavipes]|nr:hypothetical protein TNCV_831761 [Trichonephila clavipes]
MFDPSSFVNPTSLAHADTSKGSSRYSHDKVFNAKSSGLLHQTLRVTSDEVHEGPVIRQTNEQGGLDLFATAPRVTLRFGRKEIPQCEKSPSSVE